MLSPHDSTCCVTSLDSSSGVLRIDFSARLISDGDRVDRYVSDFDCHVYYPREVELLFRVTGFSMEGWFGDYGQCALRATSRQMIGVGRKAVD
jgi:hypothetical protein